MKHTVIAVLFALMLLPATASFAGEPPTVIFDHGHGQRFMVNKVGGLHLSGLGRLFDKAGYKLMLAPGKATPHMLSYADVFVISGPFLAYTPEEAEALHDFVGKGGRLAVMSHITMTLDEVFKRFGLTTSSGVIQEKEGLIDGKPTDFYVTGPAKHPLFEGLSRFAVYGAWGLGAEGDGVSVIAETGSGAWLNRERAGSRGGDEKGAPYGLVVAGRLGKGKFVFFGDDAIFQNKFIKDENEALAVNLVRGLEK